MKSWLKMKMGEMVDEYWGMNCQIPIEINAKMKKTLGMYIYEEEKGIVIPRSIHLSKEMIDNAEKTVIEHILKHEICHYILSLKNIPFMDGQKEFENELKRIGAPSTRTITIEYRILCECCERTYRCKNDTQAKKFTKKERTKCCDCRYDYGGVHYKMIT